MAVYDRVRLWIDGKLVENMMSFKPSDELTREPFIPEGESRPVGSSVTPGAEYLEVELKPNTTDVIDWEADKVSGEIRKAVAQYYAGSVRGKRYQWSVQVAESNKPESSEGKATNTVKLLVIGEGKLLSRGA